VKLNRRATASKLRVTELVVVEQRIIPLRCKHCPQSRNASWFYRLNVFEIFAPVVGQCPGRIGKRIGRCRRTLRRDLINRIPEKDEIVELACSKILNQGIGTEQALRIAGKAEFDADLLVFGRRRRELPARTDIAILRDETVEIVRMALQTGRVDLESAGTGSIGGARIGKKDRAKFRIGRNLRRYRRGNGLPRS